MLQYLRDDDIRDPSAYSRVPPGDRDASGIGTARMPPLMLGNSPAVRAVFEQMERYATCHAPVLITGESGTGKELVARAIHEHSSRAAEPFIAINCAAMPATLIGSELFGYERGAFTGAMARKHGVIEHAHRGTLFLDEIGDMPLDLQGHLLRFLQEGEIVRVGGLEPIKVDVRVIAATNVRLREAIAAGKLREDLYYRLNVLGLHLPPLRERGDDIEVLARFFLQQIAHNLALDIGGFTAEAIAAMQAYPWPGNVRELIATIRRAAVLCNGVRIDTADLKLDPIQHLAKAQSQPPRPAPGSDAERELLLCTLRKFGFNITRTARDLQVSRVTLYRMMQRNRVTLRQECIVCDVDASDAGHQVGA